MASNYPDQIDSIPRANPNQNLNTIPHSALHNLTSESVEAIQASLGVNPQGSEDTVSARLSVIENSVGGGAVDSVNGKTGAVVLTPGDLGAAPATHTHTISDVTGLQTALDDLDDAIGDVEAVLDTILEGTP